MMKNKDDTNKQTASSFQSRLKYFRKSLSLSQEEFANQLKIHRNSIFNYESGKRIPNIYFITKLIKINNLNPLWLFTGIGEIQMIEGNHKPELNEELFIDVTNNVEKILDTEKINLSPEKKKGAIKLMYEMIDDNGVKSVFVYKLFSLLLYFIKER